MIYFSVKLLCLRLFVSCIGLVGNTVLMTSIVKLKFSHVKSFELFLLGLTTANLEAIVIINIYDIIILHNSSYTIIISTSLCYFLKFMTVIGEINSILFTVLISIFRYQKLRDVNKRVNFPVFLDSIGSAWKVSGVCVMLSVLFSLPMFGMEQKNSVENITRNSTGCPTEFFYCTESHCPIFNRVYKYLFIMLCLLLPLIIVTVTSCLILTVLLSQRKTVTPVVRVTGSSQHSEKRKDASIQRSTIAILAAMGLFQVDWTIYVIFLLGFNPSDFPFWSEFEFFVATAYTSISPYVYGVGHDMFSLNTCKKR